MSIDSVYNSTTTTTPASILTLKGQVLSHNGTSSLPSPAASSGTKLISQSSGSVGLSWSTASVANTAYWNPIASSVLTADATSVTFSSIPQTYTHLCIIGRCKSKENSSSPYQDIRLNSNSTYGNYMWGYLRSGGSSGNLAYDSASDDSTGRILWSSTTDSTTNSFGCFEVYINAYTSTKNKTVTGISFAESAASPTQVCALNFGASSFLVGSAITSITFATENLNGWLSGSSFQLYGIG